MKNKFKKCFLFLTISSFLLVGCKNAETKNQDTTQTPATTTATDATQTSTTDTTTTTEAPKSEEGTLEYTLEELKQFDGKNGNKAYVAVDKIIYDVTELKGWKDGEHNSYTAGNDLTDIIKNKSPHGLKALEKAIKVGVIKE